jgi:hypothetical protein
MILESLSNFLKRFNIGFPVGPNVPATPAHEPRTIGKTGNIFTGMANLA